MRDLILASNAFYFSLKLNVVGYMQVSTQGQTRDGYSLKYQEEEINIIVKNKALKLDTYF
ncbi:hypothetical protein J7E52_08255 [Bacillus sp. ISL-34]|uniref:hypothetical protein n=1 Tax=Bacillus sp. ISL-34 TaxID=2819121 RepID=UPI001BEBA7C6|nr:hypothetical protein [Bacillus sp. ISL-34]MBT2646715.1 hypothetical protein [Bacillus sp. ISL-34]